MSDSCAVIGRICWPAGPAASGPHASRLVCAHPEHQDAAARWVEQVTGHRGVFVEVPDDPS